MNWRIWPLPNEGLCQPPSQESLVCRCFAARHSFWEIPTDHPVDQGFSDSEPGIPPLYAPPTSTYTKEPFLKAILNRKGSEFHDDHAICLWDFKSRIRRTKSNKCSTPYLIPECGKTSLLPQKIRPFAFGLETKCQDSMPMQEDNIWSRKLRFSSRSKGWERKLLESHWRALLNLHTGVAPRQF